MGYLVRSSGLPNFSKAVISTWFRVPAASLAAARAQFDAVTSDFRLPGVIPLVTFGPNSEIYTIYDAASAVIGSGNISPCVIGISCGNDTHDGAYRNTMYARMQYDTGAPAVAPSTNVYNDYFQVGSRISPAKIVGTGAGSYILVNADGWHHILISFDLSGGCSSTATGPDLTINTTCPFHWAFDDVNYASAYLWPNTPQVVAGNVDVPNGIFSDRTNQNSGAFSFAAGNIPSAGNALGIPSSSVDVGKIYVVEMAELQIFTGIALDTSVQSNRRLFITAEGAPVSPATAQAALGTPDILLHGRSNWISGTNTGSRSDFTGSGTINVYNTDPSL